MQHCKKKVYFFSDSLCHQSLFKESSNQIRIFKDKRLVF